MKLYLVIVLMLFASKVKALQFEPVPPELLKEAGAAVIIHKGTCEYKKQTENCMIGYDKAKKTTWLLLFDDEGILFKVITNNKGKEVVKWVHPAKMI